MRLASKIFATSALVVAVLVAVGVLSLRAVDRLVAVNRAITEQSVPALRKIAAVRDVTLSLPRLETYAVARQDARYAALWDERAERVRDGLRELRVFVRTGPETKLLGETMAAFEAYRAAVGEERGLLARGEQAAALHLAETAARALAERVEGSLDRLGGATHAGVLSAQADAARLEARTWAWVLGALAAAVVLALAGTAWVAARLTRSLRALSGATRAVSAGSFREPVLVRGGDEIGDLARAFNAMAGELRRLDETKQEMLAAISHELRSP